MNLQIDQECSTLDHAIEYMKSLQQQIQVVRSYILFIRPYVYRLICSCFSSSSAFSTIHVLTSVFLRGWLGYTCEFAAGAVQHWVHAAVAVPVHLQPASLLTPPFLRQQQQ